MFDDPYTIDYRARIPVNDQVNEIFYKRWSPRAFRKTDIPESVLASIFDAACWSPSCFNEQPWTFLTSSGESDFDVFYQLLTEFNRAWAQQASLLGFIIARKHFARNNKENGLAEFDCGAAWMALTLQARMHGLYTHGMGGIRRDAVRETFNIDPQRYQVVCGFAIGKLAEAGGLPDDLRNEEKPSPRHELSTVWQRGKFTPFSS